MQQQMQRKTRPKASDKGRYKLAVYFIVHESSDGTPRYFWSNKSQDRRGLSINRLKKLVIDKWKGKVNWAGLYEDGRMIAEFKLDYGQWESR